MRSLTSLLLAAAASVGLAGLTPSAKAARLLYYGFEDGTDATINNRGTGATGTVAGTLQNPQRASFQPGFTGNVAGIGNVNTGQALRLSPALDNNSADDPFVQTSQTAAALGAAGTSYTMMAWVNLASVAGDNMVFGQIERETDPERYLHNGFRNARLHQGHWGQDEGDVGPPVVPGNWMHVAYAYDNQQMTQYINGQAVTPEENEVVNMVPVGDNTEGPLQNPFNITIGKTQGNQGNFNGFLDEVKMFDTALTPEQIRQEAFVNVPEPASLGLLGLGAVTLLCRRRRQQS